MWMHGAGNRIQGIWEEKHLPADQRSNASPAPAAAAVSEKGDDVTATAEGPAKVEDGMASLGLGAKPTSAAAAPKKASNPMGKIDLSHPPGSPATDEGKLREAQQAAGAASAPHKPTHEEEMNKKLAMVAQANARAAKQVRFVDMLELGVCGAACAVHDHHHLK